MKAEMHRPVNAADPQPLTAQKLPAFDAGRKAELDAALDWLVSIILKKKPIATTSRSRCPSKLLGT